MSRENRASFADIRAAKATGRPEDYVEVWFDGELHNQYGQLAAELEDVYEAERIEKNTPPDQRSRRRVAAKKRTTKVIAEEMNKLIDDNPTAVYNVHLRAARSDEWARLKALHPPEDAMLDSRFGVHWETFRTEAVMLCLVDPEPNEDNLKFLDEVMTSGEWDNLAGAVYALNEQARRRPFSDLVASLTQRNGDG